ncbi:hypothetical protein ACMFMG_007320 [Clarireedia jacksonii]
MEFAYNAMRGRGIGARIAPVDPQPGPTGKPAKDESSAAALAAGLDESFPPPVLATGRRYYKLKSSNSLLPEEEHAVVILSGARRNEIVLNHRYDEDEIPNHYKGKDGYANFGYLKVNEQWADPDSEASLANAFRGFQDPSTCFLPGANDEGPQIKSPEELDKFYTECNVDLSDDDEPPLGTTAIDQATFKLLAQGVTSEGKGDTWGTAIPSAQEKFTSRPRRLRTSNYPFVPLPQIDEDTASLMSGVQGSHSTPSLLLSEAGVDLAERPDRFSLMSPQTDLDLFTAAYGTLNPYENIQSSTADSSEPRKYTTAGLLQALGLPQGPAGKSMLVDIQKGMDYVRNLKANKTMQAIEAERKRYNASVILVQQVKEAHYLRKHIEDNPTLYPWALEAARFYEPNGRPPLLFTPPPRALEEASVSKSPEIIEDIPENLGETDVLYLRALHDIIEGDNRLVKHYEFVAQNWEAKAANIYARIDGLLFEKEHLKMLSGLRDEHIACLVPTGPGLS